MSEMREQKKDIEAFSNGVFDIAKKPGSNYMNADAFRSVRDSLPVRWFEH